MDLRRRFNAVKANLLPWSVGLSQAASKNAVIHMGKGLSAWGAACKARKHGRPHRKTGFPPYRKRHRKMTYTAFNGRNTVKVDGCRIRLPVVGWVRMQEDLRFAGDIGEGTVSKAGKCWFASVQVHTDDEPAPPQPGPDMGVDMGVKTLATVWDGQETTTVANPATLSGALKSLRRLDKAIARSRNTHGKSQPSNRRNRKYAKRRQLHVDIASLGADHHHKATTRTAKRGGTVKVETLNVDGMKRNRRLARAISDAAMSEFVRQLEYKCELYGTAFQRVDRWYPSSKTCSACGAVKQSLLLSERTYRCNLCGFEWDRDENAARNIQAYTGHPEPARHLNEFPRPARSVGGEMDVETRKTHCRQARARSVKRLPDRQPSRFDYPGPWQVGVVLETDSKSVQFRSMPHRQHLLLLHSVLFGVKRRIESKGHVQLYCVHFRTGRHPQAGVHAEHVPCGPPPGVHGWIAGCRTDFPPTGAVALGFGAGH